MDSCVKFLVAIRCTTYNQSAYIKDALDGFCMQQTCFPFLTFVVDDASTDGEQEVINAYLNEHFDLSGKKENKRWVTEDASWVFARHKKNENCYFLIAYLKKNLYCKPRKIELIKEWTDDARYIALCEGDDYWTDPLKLQKQVDYMEAHENCSCCAHNSLRLDTKTRQIDLFNKKLLRTKDYNLETFVTKDWFTPTQSLLYRRDSYQLFEDRPSFLHGDYSLLINVLLAPGFYLHYENEIMSVYRRGGWASRHFNELGLYNDFIALFEYYKQKSNHRCDDVFDKQIERQRLEKERYLKYQNDYKKTHYLLVRLGHWVCRAIASLVNKYVPCIHVTKKLEFEPIPNLEQLD